MRVRLRRVRARSVFVLFFVLYGLVGLLVGLGMAAVSTLDLPTVEELTPLEQLGWWSLAVFPLLYGLAAGVAGALAAVLYNLAASVTGGIRLDLATLERLEPEAGEAARAAPEARAPEEERGSQAEPEADPTTGGREEASGR